MFNFNPLKYTPWKLGGLRWSDLVDPAVFDVLRVEGAEKWEGEVCVGPELVLEHGLDGLDPSVGVLRPLREEDDYGPHVPGTLHSRLVVVEGVEVTLNLKSELKKDPLSFQHTFYLKN